MIYKWLDNALEADITEEQFWNMTIAELERALKAKRRMYEAQTQIEAQQRATFDYILADLIGRSVGRIYSNATTLPEIGEVYPTLFDTEEIQEKKAIKQAEVSALRFKLFANSFNSRFKEEVRES